VEGGSFIQNVGCGKVLDIAQERYAPGAILSLYRMKIGVGATANQRFNLSGSGIIPVQNNGLVVGGNNNNQMVLQSLNSQPQITVQAPVYLIEFIGSGVQVTATSQDGTSFTIPSYGGGYYLVNGTQLVFTDAQGNTLLPSPFTVQANTPTVNMANFAPTSPICRSITDSYGAVWQLDKIYTDPQTNSLAASLTIGFCGVTCVDNFGISTDGNIGCLIGDSNSMGTTKTATVNSIDARGNLTIQATGGISYSYSSCPPGGAYSTIRLICGVPAPFNSNSIVLWYFTGLPSNIDACGYYMEFRIPTKWCQNPN